jgi:hypothetical protein
MTESKLIDETPVNQSILTRIAQKIVDRGLVTPAVFFLEMTKPISFIGSSAMVFFGPIITSFVRSETYYEFTELLEDPVNIEFLIDEIERLDTQTKMKVS